MPNPEAVTEKAQAAPAGTLTGEGWTSIEGGVVIGVLWPEIRIELTFMTGFRLVPLLRAPMARPSKLAARRLVVVAACERTTVPPVPTPSNRALLIVRVLLS